MKKLKKFLLSGSVAALLLPALAFAAYNDTTLTTDTVITANGVSVTVSGTNAVIESIVVGATSFTVTLLPGSYIEVQSTDRKVIATDAPSNYIVTDTCSATASTLKLSSSISTGSMTITPSSSTCSSNATGNSTTIVSTGSGSGSSGSGGGGGGGGTYIAPVVATPVIAAPATPAAAAAPASSSGSSSGSGSGSGSGSLTTDFGVGSKGSDVESLQTLLESKGFLTMPAGVSKGTYGAMTRSAVLSYQKSKGISQTGYVGPQTRAAVNAELGASAPAATPATPATPASASTPGSGSSSSGSLTTDFGVGSKGSDVESLQTLLESKGFLTMPAGVSKGTYGAMTRSAVLSYQKSKGISQTGYVGPQTRAAVNAELGASAPAATPATPATPAAPSASAVANANENASFKRDLETGSKGQDVKALQAYLNGHGFPIAESGAGSPGNETELFGGLTRAALAEWQQSVGITPAAGYFGPKTRDYIAANP